MITYLSKDYINTKVKERILQLGVKHSFTVYMHKTFDFGLISVGPNSRRSKMTRMFRPKRISFYSEKDEFLVNVYGLEQLKSELEFPTDENDLDSGALPSEWTYYYEGQNND